MHRALRIPDWLSQSDASFALRARLIARRARSPTAASPAPTASAPTPPTTRPPGPVDRSRDTVADRQARRRDRELDKLATSTPPTIDGLGDVPRAQARHVELADRRKVLEAIKAQVPDKTGHFATPERKTRQGREGRRRPRLARRRSTALDPDDARPRRGHRRRRRDPRARRRPTTSTPRSCCSTPRSATTRSSIATRCGRYLRKMEPYSIPALIVESQAQELRPQALRDYQLERLDRQEPQQGARRGDRRRGARRSRSSTCSARRTTARRCTRCGRRSTPTRRACAPPRATRGWRTSPARRRRPRRRRSCMLPGGKLTKKEKPLWLTYRELADNELRKAANELLHEDYPLDDPTLDDRDDDHAQDEDRRRSTSSELTKRLFEFYDDAAREAARPSSGPPRRRSPTRATSPARRPRCSIACSRRTPIAASKRRRWPTIYFKLGQAARSRSSSGRMPRRRTRRRTASIRKARSANDALAGAPLHARQGARGAGQGRRPRLPQGGRAPPRLRAREGRGATREPAARSPDLDALRRGDRAARRARSVRRRHGKTPGVSRLAD